MLYTLLTNWNTLVFKVHGCVERVAKHLKDWYIAIAAKNNFVPRPLLKSYIANVLKYKARLKVKFKCLSTTMYSLMTNPYARDCIKWKYTN